MDVNADIELLLADVSNDLKILEASYLEAKTDEDRKLISKPLIKRSLENLRSILDYAAQDVSSHIGYKKGIHFPYASDEPLFRDSVKNNLRGLKDKFPKGYTCIEEIQSFRSEDNWLKTLCKQVNINKHNRLPGQLRISSPAYQTFLGQIANLGVGCSIVFEKCMVDDIKIGWDKPIKIDWNTPLAEINRLLGVVDLKGRREYEWVEFRFEGTPDDALKFIGKCHGQISKFVKKLYGLM